MFQKNLFRAKLAENGISASKLAQIIGINDTTLYRKINGESDFTRDEIQECRTALNLSTDEMTSIFFA